MEHEVLRQIWASGESRSALELETPQAGNGKVCKRMKGVAFDGYAPPGSDLGAAWRELLASEGKLSESGESIRDLVFGAKPRE